MLAWCDDVEETEVGEKICELDRRERQGDMRQERYLERKSALGGCAALRRKTCAMLYDTL